MSRPIVPDSGRCPSSGEAHGPYPDLACEPLIADACDTGPAVIDGAMAMESSWHRPLRVEGRLDAAGTRATPIDWATLKRSGFAGRRRVHRRIAAQALATRAVPRLPGHPIVSGTA